MSVIWENFWARDGKSPEKVIVEDLGRDGSKWLKFAEYDSEGACALLDGCEDLMREFPIDTLIDLLSAARSKKAESVKRRILSYLQEDKDPVECENKLAVLKHLLSENELADVPACRRIARRKRKFFVVASVSLAGIPVGLCFIAPRAALALGVVWFLVIVFLFFFKKTKRV